MSGPPRFRCAGPAPRRPRRSLTCGPRSCPGPPQPAGPRPRPAETLPLEAQRDTHPHKGHRALPRVSKIQAVAAWRLETPLLSCSDTAAILVYGSKGRSCKKTPAFPQTKEGKEASPNQACLVADKSKTPEVLLEN